MYTIGDGFSCFCHSGNPQISNDIQICCSNNNNTVSWYRIASSVLIVMEMPTFINVLPRIIFHILTNE